MGFLSLIAAGVGLGSTLGAAIATITGTSVSMGSAIGTVAGAGSGLLVAASEAAEELGDLFA